METNITKTENIHILNGLRLTRQEVIKSAKVRILELAFTIKNNKNDEFIDHLVQMIFEDCKKYIEIENAIAKHNDIDHKLN